MSDKHRPLEWFSENLYPVQWFDGDLGNVSNLVAVIMLPSGALTFTPSAAASDRKVYSTATGLVARLAPQAGDKLMTLVSGVLFAT